MHAHAPVLGVRSLHKLHTRSRIWRCTHQTIRIKRCFVRSATMPDWCTLPRPRSSTGTAAGIERVCVCVLGLDGLMHARLISSQTEHFNIHRRPFSLPHHFFHLSQPRPHTRRHTHPHTHPHPLFHLGHWRRLLAGRLALRLGLARQAETMLGAARRLCTHLGNSPSLQTDVDVSSMLWGTLKGS